jgi:hypothetical protein
MILGMIPIGWESTAIPKENAQNFILLLHIQFVTPWLFKGDFYWWAEFFATGMKRFPTAFSPLRPYRGNAPESEDPGSVESLERPALCDEYCALIFARAA